MHGESTILVKGILLVKPALSRLLNLQLETTSLNLTQDMVTVEMKVCV